MEQSSKMQKNYYKTALISVCVYLLTCTLISAEPVIAIPTIFSFIFFIMAYIKSQ